VNKTTAYIFVVVLGGLILLNTIRIFKGALTDDAPADYRTLYTGSNLICQHKTVYDTAAHIALWAQVVQDEGLNSTSAPGQIHISALTYPPHAYAFFLFNHVLTWKQSRIIWWMVCLAFFVIGLYFIKSTWIIALGLGFKGSYFALLLGQPMLLVFALLAGAISLVQDRRHVLIGILLPIMLIKFTLVIPLVVWLAVQKDWKALSIGAALTASIYAVLIILFPSTLGDYLNTATRYYQFIYSSSPLNLYPQLNSESTSFIHTFIPMPMWLIKTINLLGQLIGFSCSILLFYKKRLDDCWLLYLLYLISFLFSYHLIYDALILLVPMALIYQSGHGRPWVYILPFVLLSLPWNMLMGALPVVQFHFPLILALALGLAIQEVHLQLDQSGQPLKTTS
jgi:hypothetical protein